MASVRIRQNRTTGISTVTVVRQARGKGVEVVGSLTVEGGPQAWRKAVADLGTVLTAVREAEQQAVEAGKVQLDLVKGGK
jgi:hypothetical protein